MPELQAKPPPREGGGHCTWLAQAELAGWRAFVKANRLGDVFPADRMSSKLVEGPVCTNPREPIDKVLPAPFLQTYLLDEEEAQNFARNMIVRQIDGDKDDDGDVHVCT